ncbi:MAG: hypothetical protein H7235_04320, partial [Bdellovibrionaceae bacterium]|nr:hypothetical protein [Pseudobdellovibrionaceae bacterium]
MDQLDYIPSKSASESVTRLTIIDSPSERIFDGPLSADMWKKVKSLKSKMPDTFDWSVYDRLYEKFGDDQPRGGVVFKTAVKLVNHHSSCTKCHYAFEIDTYGR